MRTGPVSLCVALRVFGRQWRPRIVRICTRIVRICTRYCAHSRLSFRFRAKSRRASNSSRIGRCVWWEVVVYFFVYMLMCIVWILMGIRCCGRKFGGIVRTVGVSIGTCCRFVRKVTVLLGSFPIFSFLFECKLYWSVLLIHCIDLYFEIISSLFFCENKFE